LRIGKFLSQAGVASRRQAEVLVQAGKITLNGQVITDLGRQIDPALDIVFYDGRRVTLSAKIYLLLHKPAGCISAVSDPWGRKLVTDYIGEQFEKIYPAGRLDYQSTGCLILSNDGEFVHQMIHPRYKIPKTYQVLVKGVVVQSVLELWQQGVELEEGLAQADQAVLLNTETDRSLVEIIVHQGWKRQIRRMCLAAGHPVISLCRTQIAFLNVQDLAEGSYRHLMAEEVERLLALAQRGAFNSNQEGIHGSSV
jgi:pseudouridine synthase